MKKFLLSCAALLTLGGAALAADLPVKAPPMPPPPVYSWQGFYIGGNIGGGWETTKATELAPGSAAFPVNTVFPTSRGSGWLGGVQGGYNWQAAPNFVVGLEGEYSWADIDHTSTSVSTVPAFLGFTSTSRTKLENLALGTGRIGYSMDNWLIYGKVGAAWAQTTTSGVANFANGTLEQTFNRFSNRTGWVVGIGGEWGFATNWSARIEYDYIAFDARTIQSNGITPAGVASTTFLSVGTNVNLVRAGVNYRFNWGPPLLAKY